MKTLCLALALSWGGAAYAGGAIGGSTGAKCSEYIVLRPLEFERLAREAMTRRQLYFRGEAMELEALDMDEQFIQMRSMTHRERSIIWYVQIDEWYED